MNLEDLGLDLSNLSQEELEKEIIRIREERRKIFYEQKARKRRTSDGKMTTKKNNRKGTAKKLAGMTQKQIAELKKLVGGEE